MYSIGDKIVYPMYGAGVIESMVEEEVDGSLHMYYEMMIHVGNLKIKVSADKAESLGVRGIYDKDKVIETIKNVSRESFDMPENWNQRYKENMEKIKSGSLSEVALVFRNLLHRERQRGLSSAEKKMMTTAKQIIVSEIALSQDIEKNIAEDILAGAMD